MIARSSRLASAPQGLQPRLNYFLGGVIYLVIFLTVTHVLKAPDFDRLAADRSAADRAQSLPELPVTVACRDALIFKGRVVKISNRSDAPLSLAVVIDRGAPGAAGSYRLELAPGTTRAVGGGEALPLAAGDVLRIEAAGFSPWIAKTPP